MAVRGTVDAGAGGTLVTSVTGTTNKVTASPTTGAVVLTIPDGVVLVGPVLGTPASGVATNLTGTAAGLTAGVASAVAVGGITGLGSNVATALAINIGTAGAPVTNGGALGTPSSGVGTNITGVNAATLGGATFVSPGAIGTTTPAAIKGTTIWQSSRNAYYSSAGNSPTGTTSATKVMMGLGSSWALTPSFSGRVRIQFCGYATNNTLAAYWQFNANYGTGTAPINGAAVTGTALNALDLAATPAAAASHVPVTFYAEVTGLTLATAYWFDIALLAGTAGTATVVISSVIIEEF